MQKPPPYPQRRPTIEVSDLSEDLQQTLARLETEADDRKFESRFIVPICIGVALFFAAKLIFDLIENSTT